MLEPYSRTLLLDMLRPPEDHSLDCGIGTTYSLDLVTLLTAPLAFTHFEMLADEGELTGDSLAVLQSLRRYADRLTVFCHAGRIRLPRGRYPQLEYLEQAVIECRPPSGGWFHPKLWVLRFTGPDASVIYRVLCLTRNLTFDRAWDTVLALEGPLRERKNAFAANHPLGDFLIALPGLAVRKPVAPGIAERVERLQAEVRRVEFVVPEGFEDLRFWPLGIDGYRRSPFNGDWTRMLVISPFLSRGLLESLGKGRAGNILVSRLESLANLGGAVPGFGTTFVLNEQADPEPGDENALENAGEPLALAGLHAKCYVADAGWKARVWTGSANATESAFGHNVEFLAELTGPKSRFGIDALLSTEKGSTRLRNLLQEAPAVGEAPPDPLGERLKAKLEDTRTALAVARLAAKVSGVQDRELFNVSVVATAAGRLSVPPGVTVRCWPVTRPEAAAATLEPGAPSLVTFPQLLLEDLTAFFAFEIAATESGRTHRQRFVLTLPLEGAPADRRERLLRHMLRDRDRVLRFLLLLLAHEGFEFTSAVGSAGDRAPGNGQVAPSMFGPTLLESLVRTLDRAPERLDEVCHLVEEIRKSGDAATLLPPGFDDIWQPVWAVRERLRACKTT